ncbi:nitroreductase family protein [Entomobacter blattae]|uniref:Nitroreductase family protein n=1 Tax=Entomobacter blattae TaxID=2762277 RepID=A0A7H1NT62_9PROT|nr:nitroreductase family protein [Entomobacter blattae]QNT78972.1 Nitroreductase family protein [Entomobacter blattae]
MTQNHPPRTSQYHIDPIFLQRWSPRAFEPVDIPERDLLTILEAGRWAASAYNSQPWRFLYARRTSPYWERFFNLLNDNNKAWAKDASAFILLVSAKTMVSPLTGAVMPNHTHSYSAGTAMAHLMLQATKSGWATHAMSGFDHKKARQDLNIPEDYSVDALMVVGKQADKAKLPQALQDREFPSARNPLNAIAYEGSFRK